MDELFDDLVADYKVNGRKTLPHLLSRLRLHLRPAFGKVRATALNTSRLKHYMAARLEAEAAPATVNRELEFVERALRLGAQCDPPKVVKVIRVPSLKEHNIRFPRRRRIPETARRTPILLESYLCDRLSRGCTTGRVAESALEAG
jgi:hypothetical protein